MKAIIIQDKDCKQLLEKLELTKFRQDFLKDSLIADKLTGAEHERLFAMIHRRFHYEVVSWIQEQGANLS